jgi:membrane protease YdiL (CAAX protease family)
VKPRTRLSLILWSVGFAGILSLLLIDFEALIALVPFAPGEEAPEMTPLLKALSLVQPALFLALAVVAGASTADKVGLRAPVCEALADGGSWRDGLRGQIVPGLLGGLVGSAGILASVALVRPLLPAGLAERIAALGDVMPLPTRFLYGGITEEVLLRWGLMSAIAWAAWRIFARRRDTPPGACIVGAIVASAFIFGAAHLPLAFFLVPGPPASLVVFVIVANSLFGLVAGWLYWKRGLESAMVAHVATHLLLWSASHAGMYF